MRAPRPTALQRIGLDLSPERRVYAAFFMYAFAMGGMFPRLPQIQHGLAVGEGSFGLALIGTACGTMVSLSLAAPLIERIGHRRVLLALTALLPLLYAIASLAGSAAMFFVLLLPTGLCIGSLEIVVNLEADRVEHRTGRRIMNRAHAFWSGGFFAAGIVGAALSQAGITPQWHLASMVPLVWLGVVLLLGRFQASPHRASASDAAPARLARPTWAVLLLVVVTLSSMVLEGAGIDWSAIYMRDVFAAPPFIGGLAVAIGSLAQGMTRFVADRYVERYRPVTVARALLGVLAVGTLLVFVAPSPAVALAGFALMGVGTSVIFPLAMSAAAQRSDRAAATNVAALAQFSFVTFLLGPPLLGQVAQAFGVRYAFAIGLPLVALSFAAAGALRERR